MTIACSFCGEKFKKLSKRMRHANGCSEKLLWHTKPYSMRVDSRIKMMDNGRGRHSKINSFENWSKDLAAK